MASARDGAKIKPMSQSDNAANPVVSVEEIQKAWSDLALNVRQLQADHDTLQQENKALRTLLERVVEHRQKSHNELILLLTGLVSKLPLNDVGAIVAKLVEHNASVAEVCAALSKGKVDASLPQPAILKAMEQTKRELLASIKAVVEELSRIDTPLEPEMLQALITDPETFFTPRVVRATRCYIKGQVPRERVVKDFSEQALVFFNDMTTDPKLNPRPKPEEIALSFKPDFEAWFQQNPALIPDKRNDLMALYQKIQRSKAATEPARAQRYAFQKLSFLLEVIHYYENQNTEAPDVIFAQRLPALIEQLVITGPQDPLDEKLVKEAETLMAFVVNPVYRHAIVNNLGKSGGMPKTLSYVFKLRTDKVTDEIRNEVIPEFVKHLVQKSAPPAGSLAATLRLINPEIQRFVVRAIMDTDRLNKSEAEALGKAVAKELNITGLQPPGKGPENVPPEIERQLAWEKIKTLITSRSDPGVIATAIRDRLHAKYDADELKQSWLTLIEVDPIALIRIFCALPYLADGSTDAVARNVMETYVTRLTHEKYAASYNKVVTSLRNMYRANPTSPTLLNFIALVKWLDPTAAHRMSTDIGIPATVQ